MITANQPLSARRPIAPKAAPKAAGAQENFDHLRPQAKVARVEVPDTYRNTAVRLRAQEVAALERGDTAGALEARQNLDRLVQHFLQTDGGHQFFKRWDDRLHGKKGEDFFMYGVCGGVFAFLILGAMATNGGLPAIVCNALMSSTWALSGVAFSPVLAGMVMRPFARHQVANIEASVRAQLGV